MSTLLGPSLVLIFTLSQAFRDVYFGDVFQRYDFFVIILIAFSLSTVIFAAVTLIRAPTKFRQIARADGGDHRPPTSRPRLHGRASSLR